VQLWGPDLQLSDDLVRSLPFLCRTNALSVSVMLMILHASFLRLLSCPLLE
jgi:hypothetical protein